MKSIRENVFETNSSSMHSLTVACPLNDPKLYKDYLLQNLERWGNPTDGYKIEIACDEKKIDFGEFSIREYIPHHTVNDKLIYALATVIQHYSRDITSAPYKSYNFEELPQKEQQEYFEKRKDWEKRYAEVNERVIRRFAEHIKSLEESLKYHIASKLELAEDLIQVKLFYTIKDHQIFYLSENTYFSTGCCNNEEFFYSITNTWLSFAEWICNPYSAVLAGSDEQDVWETCIQDLDTKYCIEEAEKHAEKEYDVQEKIEELESERNSENSGVIDGLIGKLKTGYSFEVPQSKVIYPS